MELEIPPQLMEQLKVDMDQHWVHQRQEQPMEHQETLETQEPQELLMEHQETLEPQELGMEPQELLGMDHHQVESVMELEDQAPQLDMEHQEILTILDQPMEPA